MLTVVRRHPASDDFGLPLIPTKHQAQLFMLCGLYSNLGTDARRQRGPHLTLIGD